MKRVLFAATVVLCAGCAGQVAPDRHLNDAPLLADYSTCLRETGTRIRVPEGQCAPATGKVYTRDQLQQTGGFTVGQALAHLLPY